jgi:hypothetical protein
MGSGCVWSLQDRRIQGLHVSFLHQVPPWIPVYPASTLCVGRTRKLLCETYRELGVKHEVIESEDPLDKRAKPANHRETTRGTRRINKYSNHGRTILQESSEYLQQQSGADFETDDDDAVTDQSGYSGHPELDHQRL